MASVMAPASAETMSGSHAPGAVSEPLIALQDRWVASAMTGPSSAIQMTPVPAMPR